MSREAGKHFGEQKLLGLSKSKTTNTAQNTRSSVFLENRAKRAFCFPTVFSQKSGHEEAGIVLLRIFSGNGNRVFLLF